MEGEQQVKDWLLAAAKAIQDHLVIVRINPEFSFRIGGLEKIKNMRESRDDHRVDELMASG